MSVQDKDPEARAAEEPSPPSARALRRARRKSLREDAVNLPNLLTMGRMVIIPLVLYFLYRGSQFDCYLAAVTFTVAAITDFLDGYLARRQNLVSVLGKFLDPLADKLIVMASLVWLVTMGRIAAWVVILLLAREITITALRAVASNEGLVIAAGRGGKSKTALQMIGIACLLLGYPYHIDLGIVDFGVIDTVHVGRMMVYLSLFFSLTSAFQYGKFFVDAVESKERKQNQGA